MITFIFWKSKTIRVECYISGCQGLEEGLTIEDHEGTFWSEENI